MMMDDRVPANSRGVWTTGLMKCCTATLMETSEATRSGDTIDCKYCEARMIVGEDGYWRRIDPYSG